MGCILQTVPKVQRTLLFSHNILTPSPTGATLSMNRAVPKTNTSPGAHDRTKKLFIANVPKTGVTEDDLMKYFKQRHPEEFGTIESVELIKKKDDEGNKTEENKGMAGLNTFHS